MPQGGRITRAFPVGQTCKGFVSYFDTLLENMDRVFIIKGGPGTGKSTLMRRIGLAMADRGYDVEFLCCSFDTDSLDGVIFPQLKMAIVDGTTPHIIDPKHPGAVDEIINLGDFWDEEKLKEYRDGIKMATEEVNKAFGECFAFLWTCKVIHDEWASYYLEGMNFEKANTVTSDLINEIFSRQPKARHLFGGACSPKGIINHIENITSECKTRYIIKGRPGSGKSSMTKKVAQAALEKGYDVDYYHCALDPDSVDMIVIPELKVCLTDGTAPHVIDPSRPGDRIIDMAECLDPEIVAKNQPLIDEVSERYEQVMEKAVARMAKAQKFHEALEKYYVSAMDFEKVDSIREKILNKILSAAGDKKRQDGETRLEVLMTS